MNYKQTKQHILLLLAVFVLFILAILSFYASKENETLFTGYRLSSDNKCITIHWDKPSAFAVKKIELTISGDDINETVSLNPVFLNSYKFENGVHGKMYSVSARFLYIDSTYSDVQTKESLFIDYDLLPKDIPLLQITTDNYVDPTAEVAINPEGQFGATVTNNDFVRGSMVLSDNGQNISSELEIRIRGNTTAANDDKKPYKIKLKHPIDLIRDTTSRPDKEWTLLANPGMNVNTYIGSYIGSLCGMEWQPQMRYVNVILNGDWKGCYLLTESLTRKLNKIDITKNGYIFENDIYWWNCDDGISFKTSNQDYAFAYTFKYPKITNPDDSRVSYLKDYMQEAEDMILSGNPRMWDYLDIDTWAAWVLGRDIIVTGDGAGSNVYYYINDLSSGNQSDRMIHMGPLWDFDAAFYLESSWSAQHREWLFYFAHIMDNPEFRQVYEDKWNSLYPHLFSDVSVYLDRLYSAQGPGLESSRLLDSARWNTDSITLMQDISTTKNVLNNQIEWMNTQITQGLE